MVHKISIETKCESKSKLLWGRRKIKNILHGECYELVLTFRNVGGKDFPGGKTEISIIYKSVIHHDINITIPEIKKGGEWSYEKITKDALGTGYASFLCEITSTDGEQVKLIRDEQELSKNASFHEIFIKTRTGLYSYYMLVISIFSLILLLIVLGLQLR